jgi:hypothetical protein
MRAWLFLFDRLEQDYVVYLGHLPSTDATAGSQGFSAVEVAHRELLNQVLDDDGRSKLNNP